MLLLDSRHKALAIFIACFVHILVMVAIVWNPVWQSRGVAQDLGEGGIEIALASVAEKPASIKKRIEPKPVEMKDAARISKDEPKQELEKPEEQEEQRLPVSDESEGGGVQLTEKNYISTLQVWLEHHKKYPYQARRRQLEGTAILYFEIDRHGNVLKHYIQNSSGHYLLDKEVLMMIERAQPLPAMPSDMKKDSLILVLPVQFSLR